VGAESRWSNLNQQAGLSKSLVVTGIVLFREDESDELKRQETTSLRVTGCFHTTHLGLHLCYHVVSLPMAIRPWDSVQHASHLTQK
jgi:hypothetical protein